MDAVSLPEVAAELLDRARNVSAGRSARTIFGGRDRTLRQTMIAIIAGRGLAEHDNPGEATLHVLSGQVRLGVGEDGVDLGAGDFAAIPQAPHTLDATADAVVILSVATGDFSGHPTEAN